MKLQTRAVKGAKNLVTPANLAMVGGLASSRVVEKALYGSFRSTFGTNDGVTPLTPAQKNARTIAKIGAGIAVGGFLVTSRNKIAKGVGVGMVTGLSWHVLNDLGVNV